MPDTRWRGFIKEYSGSTMMQCKIHDKINYEEIQGTIKAQSEFVLSAIRKVIQKRIYKGLDIAKRGGHDYEFDEIPGLL
jgi:transcription termination factor Rho